MNHPGPVDGDPLRESLIRERADELFELASHLQRTHEEENRRIARDLHDELGSLLTAAKLDIAFIKSKFAKTVPDLAAKCDRVASMIDQATALKRRIIDELRPSTLDMLGLVPAVRELLDGFVADTRIAVTVDVDDHLEAQGDAALVVYRAIEQALLNVRTHPEVANVRIAIRRTASSLSLNMTDDGTSFDQASVRDAAVNGYAAIRQRIAAIGGRVSIRAGHGGGTAIDADIPLASSPAP